VDDQSRLLIQLAAQTDVIFAPYRYDGINARGTDAAIWERRQTYHRAGLRSTGGGSEQARQDHHRQLRGLRDAGLIVLRGKTNDLHAKLTPRADGAVRRATATHTVADSWPLLELIGLLAGKRSMAAEVDIIGRNYDAVVSSDLAGLEHRCLPLLIAGYVTSGSDIDGRVGYFLTDAGRTALAAGRPAAPKGDFSNEAADLYDAIWTAGLAERESWEPINRANIVIPLSAGAWPAMPESTPQIESARAAAQEASRA